MSVNLSKGGLEQAQKARTGKDLPPVHLWNPPFCGDLDMQIKRDGSWVHEGGKINRPEMVRLFSSILKKEGDVYFLVTPVEKVGITVEDAPFVAVDLDVFDNDGAQTLVFTTQVGDEVEANVDHPIRFEQNEASEQPAVYVMVRAGLEARLDRKSFYRLIDLGVEQEHEGTRMFGVTSGDVFFPLVPVEALYES
ncbi:DUF1285 domain-containing protein [Cognatishimia sp.]|uniref:DUF1285 domain-containing protein n=1 Tax=Cognatishimia sp. TaxID=2211648 RepID=UPI003517EBFC